MAKRKPWSTNAAALDRQIAALALEPEFDGLVQLARTLAATLDVEPDANVAREYRQVLDMLGKAGAGGSDDDTEAFLVAIRTPGVSAPVRHGKKS